MSREWLIEAYKNAKTDKQRQRILEVIHDHGGMTKEEIEQMDLARSALARLPIVYALFIGAQIAVLWLLFG